MNIEDAKKLLQEVINEMPEYLANVEDQDSLDYGELFAEIQIMQAMYKKLCNLYSPVRYDSIDKLRRDIDIINCAKRDLPYWQHRKYQVWYARDYDSTIEFEDYDYVVEYSDWLGIEGVCLAEGREFSLEAIKVLDELTETIINESIDKVMPMMKKYDSDNNNENTMDIQGIGNVISNHLSRLIPTFWKRKKKRYPDVKDIVDHIYHNYMTRCEIIIMQNKMIEQSEEDVMAWCDECWLSDFAEDLKSAFEAGDFFDIDEDMVNQLQKEYESENIIKLVENYFYHNKKILRIKYHPDTPDIIDSKILHQMAKQRNALDAKIKQLQAKYEKDRQNRLFKVQGLVRREG